MALYFALSGTPPFPGGTSKEKIRRQRTIQPAPLSDMNSSIRKLARVVMKLMAKSPGDRPASAAAAREPLLPFATPSKTTEPQSVRDTVGLFDTPDAYPELWVDESGSEAAATNNPDSLDSIPLLYVPPDASEETFQLLRREWLMIGGAALLLVLLILVVVVLLK